MRANNMDNLNWTPVKTHRLTRHRLPVSIRTSQHDMYHTEPMLEPFIGATTIEALCTVLEGGKPSRFIILPMTGDNELGTVALRPPETALAKLNDNDLSLLVRVGSTATEFVHEAQTRNGMSLVMFASLIAPKQAGETYMLEAYNIIATGGNGRH